MTKFLVLENFINEPRWKAPVNVTVGYAYNENLAKILKRIFRHNNLTISFCLDKTFVKSLHDYDVIIVLDTIATDAFNKWIAAHKRESQRLILVYANRFKLVNNFSADLAKTLGFELWSYSREDCEAYNLEHYNQFHNRDFITSLVSENTIKFDAVFVANAKDRLTQMLMFQKLFRDQNVNAWFYVTKTDELPNNNCKDGRELPYVEYLNIVNQSKCIVDIVSHTNAGITNRPIEALFLRKKLITNYTRIMNESFYTPDNIFIVGHEDNGKLNDFVNSTYSDLDERIIKQYTPETFYETILTRTPPPHKCHQQIRISIAIATYNGVKWIGKQLDSIRAQTLTPDEVIISDDCSTDGTYEFCEKYISDYELEGWKVYRNENNVGLSKNFRLALSKCTGDYVFTCDQDDEWLPDKIKVMVKTLEDYPEIRLLISNYIPIYNGELINTNTLKNLGRNDGEVVQYKLENCWLDPVRPGCTYCLRREMIGMFNEFDIEGIYHDAMLWIYAVVSDSLYLINRQLSYWIRHEGTVTGKKLSAYPTINERMEWITRDEKIYHEILNAHEKLYISRRNQKLLRDKLSFMERRKKMLAKRNLFRAAIFVLMNLKFYPTFRNALSDIYAMIFLR